ncbi:hypothetical protein ZEAMMB73_Zm00001d009958 [Zea mays]|uniref:Uncharacterized protein n=1 Tax=Zea mays TaxID=4577 RepID=A0A1D6FND1_MAIZE|nr:hypothetical protein ZEAMMB73_Zm00001d009958 [Zea mays]
MTDGELLWRASFTPAVPILTRMEGCLHVPHARAGAAQGVPHYYIYVHALSANFTFESIFSQRQIPTFKKALHGPDKSRIDFMREIVCLRIALRLSNKDDDQYRSYLNNDRLSSPPKKYVAQSTYRIKASQLHKLQSDFTDPENDNH